MKKIEIVYRDEQNEAVIRKLNHVVEDIFYGYAEVETCYANRLTDTSRLCADVYLVIDRKLLPFLRNHTDELKNVVMMERSISKTKLKDVLAIPKNSRVLVVNDTEENAEEMVYMLYELGIGHLQLIPYAPSQPDTYADINYAITPDEMPFVPAHIQNVINTGYRMLSFDAISKIAEWLALEPQEAWKVTEKMIVYSDSVVTPMREFQTSYLDGFLKSQMLNTYVSDSSFAILLADKEGRLLYCNHEAKRFFGEKISRGKGNAYALDPQLAKLLEKPEFSQQLLTIDRHNFIADKFELKLGDVKVGFYVVLKDETEITAMERSLNKKLVEKGLFAKHSFRDIKHRSKAMEDCIQHAKAAAATEYTVLIIGESGTGKELIAQAIHNDSQRKNRPFVGVNCAAIPKNLLESELFGYVGGAFTGADKNGKIGYFERANHGTIFLDEIGDVSPAMQAKLLRVIQERQIIRVGSDRVIDLDVRIIAATNKNLLEAVEKERFREDLYYRLNVLQIKMPPLRARKEDIAVLLEYFLKDDYDRLSKEEKEYLKKYQWPGNIRELENCALYYKTMGRLPESIEKTGAKESLLGCEDSHEALKRHILALLRDRTAEGQGLGRAVLYERLQEKGIHLSDIRLRKLLEELQNEGMIEVNRGRKGTCITKSGFDYLRQYSDWHTSCYVKD